MKKLILTSLFLVSLLGVANAQVFEKGSKNINLGLGLGWGTGVVATGDVGISDVIGIGAGIGYSSKSYFTDYKLTHFSIGGRVSAHLNKFLSQPLNYDVNKLDLYLGLAPTFSRYSYSQTYLPAGSVFNIGGFAGVRYHFKDKMGVYFEGGWPYSSLGLTFKM